MLKTIFVDLGASLWYHKWKILGIILFVGALLGAYAWGRYKTPAKVIEKEKIVDRIKEVEKVVTKVEYQKVYVTVEKQKIKRQIVEVKDPNGCAQTTTTEDISTEDTTKSAEVQVQVQYKDRIVEREKIVEKEKVVVSRPNWRLGPLVGLNIPTLVDGTPQPIEELGPVTIGVMAERRVAGPVSLNAWGLTSGQVGLGATIEW